MIPDIKDLNFPKKDGKQYATLTHATANIADMGEKTISTQIKIDGDIVPDFSFDWEVEFQGEKYIMPLRIPQGVKENTSLKSTIDLTFQHWAIYQLKRWPFVTIQQIAAGTYLPDEEVATVSLNLKDLCNLFGQVLAYYYGDTITIDLNPEWQYSNEPTVITISHTKIWNVLIDVFHNKYGVRWGIEKAPSRNLLLGSGVVIENSNYNIAKYTITEKPVVGENVTVTIWGNLHPQKNYFQVYNSGGWVGLGILKKIGDGVYSGIFPWKIEGNGTIVDSEYLSIFSIPSSIYVSNRIDRIKLEIGANENPQYSPAPEDLGLTPTDSDNHYVIRVGYPTTEVDHIFEYGFEGGLLKVERRVQSEEIRNMLKGRGGETNIPFRYFKDTDPNNTDFRPDPDWVEELANIYFPNLMGATFRSYVQGWKAAHINQTDADGKKIYDGYTPVGEANAYAPWAYRKGYTDTKFSPVEFVADEITINPATGDRQVEILPGYSPYVKKGSSLDKYGPLPDTLDNNDEIYPTLQGTGLDIAVAVEEIKSDDVGESISNDAQERTLPTFSSAVLTVPDNKRREISFVSEVFTVEDGKTSNVDGTVVTKVEAETRITVWFFGLKTWEMWKEGDSSLATIENISVTVVNVLTGEELPASGIPAGRYYIKVRAEIQNTLETNIKVQASCSDAKQQSATLDDNLWTNTFDIWVKNIWDSTRLSGETDSQYAERVWKPVLGDREKNTAKVVFTSGALAHEDYEFTIVDFPAPDTSKTWEEKDSDGNVIAIHTSHWRIKLAKSDAELEATGLYVPSTQKQGNPGDRFVFIGTEMTHVPYVVDAEERLDDWKKDQLGEVKEIKPTAVVTTDRVRLNNEGKPNALINQLRVGNSLRLFDKRFFNEEGKAYETLYLQSITYTYREPTSDDAALNPDVEIVLGNEYATSANPVTMMQGEISALQKQVGAISNVEQIVRAVGDKLYLRKDGISDRSLSPTKFFSLLTSGDFRSGLVGGAGWGFFKDENGNWVLEADRINVRKEMQVNTVVINQAEGKGGMEIDTAAYINGVTRVIDTDNGYVCYFDQRDGSIANLFQVDDVAYCNRWTPENAQLKFYKRRVTAVSADSITLSKTDVNGTGIPSEGDNIIHFGNYSNPERQYVKVRDVVGGGYERYIEALNSVNSAGVEYYFIGKQSGETRWFVGNKDFVPYSGAGDGSYIEYINRKFNLNNVSLSINTTVGDKTLAEYIQQVSPPVEQEDIEQFVNNIVDPKLEGIQNQIDGVIESFFGFGAPTLTNYPANEWTTDEAKKAHANDTYTDKTEYVDDATTPTAGQSWKWQYTSPTDYGWVKIADSDAVKALLDAAKAQDTADSKRRVFTAQPVPPYDEGDIWVNATYPVGTTAETRDPANGKYYNDILRCNVGVHKTTGSFSISDWGLASSYTDDTLANEALSQVKNLDYLKAAFKQKTTINAGVVLTSLVSLGVNNDDFTTQTAYSGISGLYDSTAPGNGIAAWYGGDMIDKASYYDWNEDTDQWVLKPGADVSGLRIAAGLDRMDGTGYRANGGFWWDIDGKIHVDPLSFFVGEETVGNVLGLFKYYPSNTTHFENVTSAEPQRPFTRIRLGTDREDYVELTYSDGALRVNKGIVSTENIMAFGAGSGELPDSITALLSNYATKSDLSAAIAGIKPGLDINALEDYLTDNSYATQDWVAANFNDYTLTKAAVEAVLTGNITTHTHSQYLTANSLDYIVSRDTRNDATLPDTYGMQLRVNFKYNSVNGLNDGRIYNTEIWIKGYGGTTDFSGVYPHLLSFTENGNIWHRYATSKTAWGEWKKLLDSGNTKIENGTVTINGVSITPLTEHQSLSNYVTLNTEQTIKSKKIFAGRIAITASLKNAAMPYFLGRESDDNGGEVKHIASYEVANAIGVYKKTEIDAKLTNGSVTKVGTATVGSSTKPMYLSAGVPTASTSTVGASNKPIFLSNGTLTATTATNGAANLPVWMDNGVIKSVTSVGDAYISWGGENLVGKTSPLDAAINGNIGVNRFAFLRNNGITVEYTEDGQEWLDYEATVAEIQSLFSGPAGSTLKIGKGARTDTAGLRITVDGVTGALYCDLRKIMVNVSTQASQNCYIKVEVATYAAPDVWDEIAYSQVRGWSGWNTLNIPSTWLGQNSSGRVRYIRFTFSHQSVSGNYEVLQVYNIFGFSQDAWTFPSNMARTGHLYNYDASQNATFPADVTANTFVGKLNGVAGKATKLETARTIWGQNFDGSGNVSGNLTGVGSINTVLSDISGTGVARMHITSNSALTDWIHLYVDGNGNNNRPLVLQNGYGNVGIGTATPAYKLDVNGTTRISGTLTIGSITLTDKGDYLEISKTVCSQGNVVAFSEGGSSLPGSPGGGSLFGLMRTWPSSSPGADTTDALGANLGYELYQTANSLTSRVTSLEGKNFLTAITKSQVENVLTGNITSHSHSSLSVRDLRSASRLPSYFDVQRLTPWFNNTGTPASGWYAGINVKGWNGSYASWELAATANSNINEKNLYFRVGIGNEWQEWQKVLTSGNEQTLTIQRNGNTAGTYKPSTSAIINISDVASAATLSSHTSNTTVHITASERTAWNNKVDKVTGKGLSANDFTDALLTKLNGIEAGANKYVLPTATASVKGGVKVGSGLTITSETLAVSLSASHIPSLSWSKITSGKPTTLAGYGITDAKIANGVITLGSNSITPVTHPAMEAYIATTLADYAVIADMEIYVGTYNAASATKLKTARKIWGQNFDGSGNISGDITNVTGIYPAGSYGLVGDANRQWRYVFSEEFLSNADNGATFGVWGGQNINFIQNGVYVMQILADRTLSVLGDIISQKNITAFSDGRLKIGIEDLKNRGFLRPRTYIKDGRQEIGFIAQEVREIYPELVIESQTPEKYLALNYQNLTAVLAAQINNHETRIRNLENRLGYGK